MNKCGNVECPNNESGACSHHHRASKCVEWEDDISIPVPQLLREKRAFVKQYVLNRTLTLDRMGRGTESVEAGANAFDAIMKLEETK